MYKIKSFYIICIQLFIFDNIYFWSFYEHIFFKEITQFTGYLCVLIVKCQHFSNIAVHRTLIFNDILRHHGDNL